MEWIREGHRNYPLIGRTPPYSALHILADHASKAALVENSELSRPSDTKRAKVWSIQENRGQQIVTDDPNLPPPSSTNFGISRKDLKKSFDLTSLHQNVRKKHYQLLKPPPPPNVKIQHLYQTLANIKRPRKSLTKKCSKTRIIKQLPGKMTYPSEERQFDGAELQRHLTSQLMPPPMSPVKSASLSQGGVVKKDSNLMKMNNQLIEPHVNIVSINPTRLKSELMNESTKARTARTKSSNIHSRLSYHQKYSNGAGSRSIDNIPDPQIIFNTTSLKIESKTMEQHNSHESDLTQQSMTSPLQLLSTAASCTPKLKVTPVTSSQLLPSYKTVPNRAMKIVPTTAKPVIIKPADPVKPSQTVITTQSSKFKIQKIQLVVNKNQDGSAANTSNLSPSATIVSGKAGQLLLSGKGITNSYHLSGKTPYTIVNAQKSIGPKVIVQTIDRCFSDSSIPENQRITENTPIDFMPASSTSSFPKVIIQKTQPTKQIKLKLGTSLVSPKIIKGPIPANLKIHRNINTKGFTVVNSSQIVQFQPQNVQPAQVPPSSNPTEGSKVDWEQELDDANRKDGKSNISNGSLEPAAKKIRIDEGESGLNSVEASDVIEILNTASVIYGEF